MTRGIFLPFLIAALAFIAALIALHFKLPLLAAAFVALQFLLTVLCLLSHHHQLHRLQKSLSENQPLLARAQQSAAHIINSLPQPVALLSPEGLVEIANAHAAIFGLAPGKDVAACPHPWLHALIHQVHNTRKPANLPQPVQIFHETRELFFFPHASPIFDPEHHLAGITVVLIDITQLRQVQEAKFGLVASVSHELKTPLTSIQMSIHLLLQDAAPRLNPKQLDLLNTAREEADRLTRLIDDFLNAARNPPPH